MNGWKEGNEGEKMDGREEGSEVKKRRWMDGRK